MTLESNPRRFSIALKIALVSWLASQVTGGWLTAGGRTALRTMLIALGCGLSAQPPTPMSVPLRVGFQRSSFLEVNPTDLAGSFKLLAKAIGRKHNVELKTEVFVFETSAELELAMQREQLQVAVLGAWNYLDMETSRVMEPCFVHSFEGRILTEYLVLTHRESGLNTLSALKGKDLLLLERSSGLLSAPWLDILLAEERLGPKEAFFRKVEVVQKPTAAVLPVFFGNRQACVVDRGAYAIMAELNPQISTTLQVVASSTPYLNSITCISREGWPSEQIRNEFKTALKDLHLTPEGRLILLIFKADRIEPFTDQFLKSISELRLKHKRLLRKPTP
jgi:phosphonate transport system substrate-binding protein